MRNPAEHHGICTCVSQHIARLLPTCDVAVGHHRNLQGGLHLGNRVVLSQALVALLAGAAVHRDHGHACAFGSAGNRHGVFVLLCPASAHFERDGHIARCAGIDHCLNNLERQFFVLHQCRACPFTANFFSWATHVDVNDLRAPVYVVGRSIGHHLGVGTGNLYSNWLRLAVVIGTSRSLERVPQIAPRCDHFTDRITSAQFFAQHAKRPVCDTRHWRGKHVVRQSEGADKHELEIRGVLWEC